MPHGCGVILSLARLSRILELDPVARTARVQPGVRNLQVSEAAAPHGLYYAPDPSSQIACSIGGNVAENSGGVHCLKYGLTVHNVMRVRGYTIEGELLELGSGALDCPGLDLLALAIGSEGLLVVVTEITVKLIPRPQLAQLVMASFDDVAKAGEAVAAIIAAGIIPAGLEMMDRKATAAVEPFVKAGYDLSAQAILLAEADGTPDEVAEQVVEIERVVREAGATAITVSNSEAERLRFWSGRKNAFPAAGRVSPDYYCMDGTIPRKKPRACTEGHRADGTHLRPALHERLPCRRWQSAPADPVRCQRSGRMGACRSFRCANPGIVRAARRNHYGRAWRGSREDQFDVRAILPPASARLSLRSKRHSTRLDC